MPRLCILSLLISLATVSVSQTVFFIETFDDSNLAARGWYDNTNLRFSDIEHIPGSQRSAEYRFLQGARTPQSGGGIRRLFPASDEVYLSYWVKYSTNWTGSNRPYHPHEFHFVTNKDDRWVGPAWTNLTTYIEQNEGRPLMGIQDGRNIDAARINQDLTAITENRAVAGCNGSSDRYPKGDCYNSGTEWRNGKSWKANRVVFTDTTGRYDKNEWHFIEAYFRLNRIVDGKGIADGIVRYWFDGQLMIDAPDVMLRTGRHADMKFNQFLIAPYIGDGSPVDQTMWVDDLTVASSRIGTPTPVGHDTSLQPDIELMSVYPMPVISSASIRLRLARLQTLRIEIQNLLGQKVRLIHEGVLAAGDHAFAWSAHDQPSGLYRVIVLADGFRSQQFVRVLK